MQALQSGHRISELPATFPCAECGQTIVHTLTTGGTGYAVRASDHEMICYACATANELASASETGKLFAYVKGVEYKRNPSYNRRMDYFYRNESAYYATVAKDAAITTWPGNQINIGRIYTGNPYQSNFGDVRITIYCHLPTGPQGHRQSWYGTYYASVGDYCRLTRNKHQLADTDVPT